jgi:hypothetical protein
LNEIVHWQPSAKQALLISCPVFEALYGGARGGGKTDAVLGEFIEHADAYGANASGLMVRRTFTELSDTIERSKVMYTPLGWEYHTQEKRWRAPNGARLIFAYLERDADADQYMGHNYTRVYIEEIGNFPSDKPILKLMATLRSGAGVPCLFRATGNPGGPGQSWVRARYGIDKFPSGFRLIADSLTGLERVFIPARVDDNPHIDQAKYVQQLKGAGSAELVRAWLDGDWSAVQGAFFDCWRSEHVIAPFAIPRDWLRLRCFDWGFASPFACYWIAVAGDDYRSAVGSEILTGATGGHSAADAGRASSVIPRGALVVYREWYGTIDGKFNEGLRLTAEQIADGILQRDRLDAPAKITYGVADPSMFSQDGGPSHAERMAVRNLHWSRADNKRVAEVGHMGGWDQMRSRLVGEHGRPMLYFFNTCVHAIRTIPALQHDPDKPEDLDTEAEDHAADAVRYGCMARPWIPRAPRDEKPVHTFVAQSDGSVRSSVPISELIKRLERKRRG